MKATSKTILFLTLYCGAFISNTMLAQVPVRNEAPRVGQQEIIMMRHAYLEEGQYEYWKEQSFTRVWPWFERLGARIIGDFKIVYPLSEDETPGQDEALRFARYASYEHWQATRAPSPDNPTGGSLQLSGSGPLYDANNEGLRNRRTVAQGSKEAVFLRGYMAETRPVFMPGTAEEFELTDADSDINPVALARSEPGDELLLLSRDKVTKGSFEEIHALSRDGVWPYMEKIGVRPVGQWRVVYLQPSTPVENDEYDEVYSLYRIASIDHYQAIMGDIVALGGDGPDYDLLVSSLEKVGALTQETTHRFLRGQLWGSPPSYAPPLDSNYRLAN